MSKLELDLCYSFTRLFDPHLRLIFYETRSQYQVFCHLSDLKRLEIYEGESDAGPFSRALGRFPSFL